MGNATTVSVDKSVTLEALNSLTYQQEQLLGPLAAIGIDQYNTLLTLSLDQDPPDKAVRIQRATDPVPINSATVCKGLCFIEGVKSDVVAYREL